VKSSISSVVPAAILCMDDMANLTTPSIGDNICEGSEGVWPPLDPSGSWNATIEPDVTDGNFSFAANYGLGHCAYAVCTETGCTFYDDGC
jgi:hypothetical protein